MNKGFSRKIQGLLQSPGYRFYYLAILGQSAGMMMGQVTSPLLMYRLTGSTLLLGTTSLMAAIPLIVMSLLGGVFADRISKKQIIFASLLGFAAANLAVAAGLHSGLLSREHSGSWVVLLFMAFIQGGLMGIMMPAMQAVVPEIVSRDLLMNASTLNILGLNVLGLAVPTLTGLIIDHIGFEYAYYATAGLYAVGAVATQFLPASGRIGGGSRRMIAEMKNGLAYILRTPVVLIILLLTTAIVCFSMPYQQFLPVFTDKILGVGATGMGLLMSMSGAGALAGSLLLAFMPISRRGLILIFAGLLGGAALAAFSFSSLWALSLGMMVLVGVSQTLRNTLGNALLMTCTEAAFMGRVMSLLNIQWGLMAIITFLAGLLAGAVSIQWVIGSLAMALIVISIVFLALSPAIRRLE